MILLFFLQLQGNDFKCRKLIKILELVSGKNYPYQLFVAFALVPTSFSLSEQHINGSAGCQTQTGSSLGQVDSLLHSGYLGTPSLVS